MFYVLKVVEGFIFPPGLIVLLAVGLGCVLLTRHNIRSAISVLALAGFVYALSTQLVANSLAQPLESAYPQPAVKQLQGDAIVMLGGGAVLGTPDGNGQGNLLGHCANRLITTDRLYRQLHIPVILSGGPLYSVHKHPVSEALIARRELIALGVPASDITTEIRSRNTQQNAVFTKPILQQKGIKQPILVTSAFHMRRAVMNFHKAGISVIPYPTDYQVSRVQEPYEFRWLPSARALSLSAISIKEYVGIVATTVGVHG